MDDKLFEDDLQQFIRYEKDVTGKKTRQQKKKQKLIKLKSDYQDPIQKKQRQQIRRKQYKIKLSKQLSGMNQQQIQIYLHQKKLNKILVKQKNIKALQIGLPILIDNVFQHKMNDKENKSLAIQIQLIMKTIKHMDNPPGIHLCSVTGTLKSQLQKMRYQYWTLTSTSDNVLQVSKKLNKNPIYLSPDATQQLQQISPNNAYIIGGLVDRTVIKNASLTRASQLQIPAVTLPIRKYMKSRTCLNLDHVVMMLCKFNQLKDWKLAFDSSAPKRWKRDAEQSYEDNKQDQQQEQQI